MWLRTLPYRAALFLRRTYTLFVVVSTVLNAGVRAITLFLCMQPDNILCKVHHHELRIALGDMGVHTRIVPGNDHVRTSRCGSPFWMSPEVFAIGKGEQGNLTCASDVYSACLMGVELLEATLFSDNANREQGLRQCASARR